MSWTGSTLADDKPERPAALWQVPTGTKCTIDGVELKAFSVDEYKTVKHIFADYSLLWRYSLSLEKDIISFKADLATWETKYNLWKNMYDKQKDTSEFYRVAYKQEHKLRIREEKADRVLGWIPWTIVVVESIAIGIFGIYSSTLQAE